MAEKVKYPQIPSTVWWGVRSILHRTPNATIDERFLAVQLNVQATAAKTYINELKNVNILTDEGKATQIANKWRLDTTYQEAVRQIIDSVYPENLISLAPPGNADRQKVISWFLHEGLGQGTANNKAATYLLISSPTPNDAGRPTPKSIQADGARPVRSARKTSNATQVTADAPSEIVSQSPNTSQKSQARSAPDTLPLNVNIQIHISADAGTEQIESIFQAMKRYLYDNSNS